MANVYHSNMWILDTAGVIWAYATKGPILIRKLIWKPSAAGQTLLINENSGKSPAGVIWSASSSLAAAPAGIQELEFGCHGKWFDGMTLTTLTATGVLEVYFG